MNTHAPTFCFLMLWTYAHAFLFPGLGQIQTFKPSTFRGWDVTKRPRLSFIFFALWVNIHASTFCPGKVWWFTTPSPQFFLMNKCTLSKLSLLLSNKNHNNLNTSPQIIEIIHKVGLFSHFRRITQQDNKDITQCFGLHNRIQY